MEVCHSSVTTPDKRTDSNALSKTVLTLPSIKLVGTKRTTCCHKPTRTRLQHAVGRPSMECQWRNPRKRYFEQVPNAFAVRAEGWVRVCVLMWLPVYDHVQRMPKTETTTQCCKNRHGNGSLTHFVVQPRYDKLIPTGHICPCLMKQMCVVSDFNATACFVHGVRPKSSTETQL